MKNMVGALGRRQDGGHLHQIHVFKIDIVSKRPNPVVNNSDLVPRLHEHIHHVRPDKTAPACHDYFGHFYLLPNRWCLVMRG